MSAHPQARLKLKHSKLPLLLLALAVLAAACQSGAPAPTLDAPLELASPTAPPTAPPTRRFSPTPRDIHSPTPRPTATLTLAPTRTPDPLGLADSLQDEPPPATIDPALLTQVAVFAGQDLSLSADTALVGRSVEGRAILARRLGRGSQTVLLVGGTHGGFEVNTVALMNEVIAHFAATPEDIAPGLALVVIPVLNPDGLLRGREPAGRFNARGVDLNRNWGCAWAAEAFWRDQTVDPGPEPFSEPEGAALADYILLTHPVAALFYHSAANGVFAGACGGDHGSQALGHVYGQAANYPSDAAFTHYEVTGDASSWVDGQGIPSITIELQSWLETEWERNYAGIMAVQCEIARHLIDPAAAEWVAAHCDGAEDG